MSDTPTTTTTINVHVGAYANVELRQPGEFYTLRVEGDGNAVAFFVSEEQLETLVNAINAAYEKRHPECSICRRRHGREVTHACE